MFSADASVPGTVSFFPQVFAVWKKSIVVKITKENCRPSIGKSTPRGVTVKQKMSKFQFRLREDPLNPTIES